MSVPCHGRDCGHVHPDYSLNARFTMGGSPCTVQECRCKNYEDGDYNDWTVPEMIERALECHPGPFKDQAVMTWLELIGSSITPETWARVASYFVGLETAAPLADWFKAAQEAVTPEPWDY